MRTKKRDDWKLIKKGGFNEDEMKELCSLPLLIQDALSAEDQHAFLTDVKRIDDYLIQPFNKIREFLENSIGNDFLVIQKFMDPNDLTYESFVYARIFFEGDLLNINTFRVGEFIMNTHCALDLEKAIAEVDVDNENSRVAGLGQEELNDLAHHTLTHVSLLFNWIEENINLDKYMISDHVPNPKPNEKGHRPHMEHDSKPYMRGDLTSVRFLNSLPSPNKPSEHKGGTHRSPVAHKRRAHTRVLKHPKYKNHPKYMKPKLIPAYWVGDKTSVVGGVLYKVLQRG